MREAGQAPPRATSVNLRSHHNVMESKTTARCTAGAQSGRAKIQDPRTGRSSMMRYNMYRLTLGTCSFSASHISIIRHTCTSVFVCGRREH